VVEETGAILVTGGSRGIGGATVERLLSDHPGRQLVLAGRELTLRGVAQELAGRTSNGRVSTLECDLASLAGVRSAAAELVRRLDAGELPPLRGYLGCAGIQLRTRTERTVDGLEPTFQVNVLANYLLLRLLLPHLQAPARVVLVGDGVHFGDVRHNSFIFAPPRWDTVIRLAMPDPRHGQDGQNAGQTAYATSKLAVVYLTHALARRLPEGVDVYTYAPGIVPEAGIAGDDTTIPRLLGRGLGRALQRTRLADSPDEAGAALAAAVAGPRPGPSGSYLDRGQVARSSAASYDPRREEELWAGAAQLCGLPLDLPR